MSGLVLFMRNILLQLTIIIVLLYETGCASNKLKSISIGENFSVDEMGIYKIGLTTKDNVISKLGTPDEQSGSGNMETLKYTFSNVNISPNPQGGPSILFRNANFIFVDNILKDFSWGYDSPETKKTDYGNIEIGRPFDVSKMSSLKTGEVTPHNVVTQFGQPTGRQFRYDGTTSSMYYLYSNSLDSNGTGITANLSFEKGVLKNVSIGPGKSLLHK